MKFAKIKSKLDLYATIIVFLLIIVFQIIAIIVQKDINFVYNIEYGNIAASMLDGKGFSNPFYPIETGPSAWMPPLLVFLIYLGFLVFGITVKAFIFLSLLKFVSFAFTFYLLLKILRLVGVRINYFILIIIYLLYYLFNPSDNFFNIHDFWLVQLFISIFLFSLLKVYYGNKKYMILLSIIIFIMPFTNPGFALGCLITSGLVIYIIPLFSALKDNGIKGIVKKTNHNLVRILTLGLVFIISVSIWTTRNYMVFNKFVPTKSNMWLEFYMSNIVDSSGQLSQATLHKTHPIYITELSKEMGVQGEVNWMESYRIKGLSYLESNIDDYLNNIANRLFNAFIFIEYDKDKIYSKNYPLFSESDISKLDKYQLMKGRFWISLDYTEQEILRFLQQYEIQNEELIFKDWNLAKSRYLEQKYSIPYIVRSSFFAIIPTMCILLLFLFREIRRNPLFHASVSLYILYLIPYVLVSHQIRYQRPLFLLQIIFVYLISQILFNKLIKKNPR